MCECECYFTGSRAGASLGEGFSLQWSPPSTLSPGLFPSSLSLLVSEPQRIPAHNRMGALMDLSTPPLSLILFASPTPVLPDSFRAQVTAEALLSWLLPLPTGSFLAPGSHSYAKQTPVRAQPPTPPHLPFLLWLPSEPRGTCDKRNAGAEGFSILWKDVAHWTFGTG